MKFVFAVALFWYVFSVKAQTATSYPKTYESNGIQLRSYDFKTLEPLLHQSNDTTYVVNFWATWCQPCVAELPHFEKLGQAYADKKVKVILVSLDLKKQVPDAVTAFMKKRDIKSAVVHLSDPDANAWIPKVNPQWSGAIPATLIYNKDKRAFFEQTFTYAELEKQLKTILSP